MLFNLEVLQCIDPILLGSYADTEIRILVHHIKSYIGNTRKHGRSQLQTEGGAILQILDVTIVS